MRKTLSLLSGDFRAIRRDATLLMSMLAPLIIAVIARIGLPLLSDILIDKLNFDLTEYYTLILSFVIVLIPFILGISSGLLLLDEKDENILTYITVTPMSREGYIFYKIISPMIVSAVSTLFAVIFIGIKEIDILKVIPVIIICSMEAPIIALVMVKFASNKIQGLVISKGIGFILLIPIAAYFIKIKWSLILGVFPTYWTGNAFVASFEEIGAYLFYIIGGVIVNGIYLTYLYKKW
jgi:fluoroquinolone transport system permease protein